MEILQDSTNDVKAVSATLVPFGPQVPYADMTLSPCMAMAMLSGKDLGAVELLEHLEGSLSPRYRQLKQALAASFLDFDAPDESIMAGQFFIILMI